MARLGNLNIIKQLSPLFGNRAGESYPDTIKTLIHSANIKVIEALIPLLNKGDKYVRLSVVRALGKLGAIDRLSILLKDKDIRIQTMETLGDLKAIDQLTPLLNDADKDIRLKTMEVLASNLITRNTPSDPDRKKTMDAPKLKNPFFNMHRIKREAKRLDKLNEASSGNLLAVWDSLKLLEQVSPLLEDTDEEIQQAATISLSNIIKAIGKVNSLTLDCLDNPDITEHLAPLLMKKSDSIRLEIINVLGNTGNLEAVEPLAPLLKERSKNIRLNTINALGHMDDKESAKHLIPLLRDGNANIRFEAAKTLSTFGVAEAIDPLLPTCSKFRIRIFVIK